MRYAWSLGINSSSFGKRKTQFCLGRPVATKEGTVAKNVICLFME
jgi:hypothetical protein